MNKIGIATLPERIEKTLHSKADEIRKIINEEQRLKEGAELLAIVYRLSESLAAVGWELRGILGLRAKVK